MIHLRRAMPLTAFKKCYPGQELAGHHGFPAVIPSAASKLDSESAGRYGPSAMRFKTRAFKRRVTSPTIPMRNTSMQAMKHTP